jgi:hypothetical protein
VRDPDAPDYDPDQPDVPPGPEPRKPNRFFGSVALNGTRVGRDAGQIADEVISHLAALPNSKLTVTLEIQAEIPDGVDERTTRIVNENANTLKFDNFGFEEE